MEKKTTFGRVWKCVKFWLSALWEVPVEAMRAISTALEAIARIVAVLVLAGLGTSWVYRIANGQDAKPFVLWLRVSVTALFAIGVLWRIYVRFETVEDQRDAAREKLAEKRTTQQERDELWYVTLCIFTQYGRTELVPSMPPETCTLEELDAWFMVRISKWEPLMLKCLEQTCGIGAKSRVTRAWPSPGSWQTTRSTLVTMLDLLEQETRAYEALPGFNMPKRDLGMQPPTKSPFQQQLFEKWADEIRRLSPPAS